MGVLASWRTPDGRWLVDFRVWRQVDGHILHAELHGPVNTLRTYLASQGVNLDDVVPAGAEDDEDLECE